MLRTLGRIANAGRVQRPDRRQPQAATRSASSDIGRAEDSVEEPRGLSRLDGENAVSLFVQKQSGTNTVAIADAVQARLAKIAKALPPDIKIEMIQDQSRFIRESMRRGEVPPAAGRASWCRLTILLFIRDWRTTLIATLAIPDVDHPDVPVHAAAWASRSTTSRCSALILAIGIVIDDAVVVHENIFRHMEEYGKDAMEAARDGTREIALAVLATSLSLVVIFVPIAFMGGMVGRFFSSFGLTVAFADRDEPVRLVHADADALLALPQARPVRSGPRRSRRRAGSIGPIDGVYGLALRWALRHRLVMVVRLRAGGPLDRADRRDAGRQPGAARRPERVPGDASSRPKATRWSGPTRSSPRSSSGWPQLPGVVHRFTTIGENTGTAGKGQGDVTRGSIYFRIKDLDERQLHASST